MPSSNVMGDYNANLVQVMPAGLIEDWSVVV